MPFGRGGMGYAPFVYGLYYIIGGETCRSCEDEFTSEDGIYQQVTLYNATADTWADGPRLPIGIHGTYPVIYSTFNFQYFR